MTMTARFGYLTIVTCRAPFGLFKGLNIMTPNFQWYAALLNGNYAELSSGRGIEEEEIFGVTVRPDSSLGKLFHSRAAAFAYVLKLQGREEEAV